VDSGQAFIHNSRNLLTVELLPRVERSVERLTDAQLWWRPNEESNSAGNLMLHMAGNVRQWIVSGVGGATDARRRQEEFDERGPLPRADVLDRLRRAVADADTVLAGLSPASLPEVRHVQKHDVTILYAIYHVVEHFSMHTGQIIYIAKLHSGDMRFFELTGGKPTPTWTPRQA
jgi:uncharacterized damage-inducible protein DinB